MRRISPDVQKEEIFGKRGNGNDTDSGSGEHGRGCLGDHGHVNHEEYNPDSVFLPCLFQSRLFSSFFMFQGFFHRRFPHHEENILPNPCDLKVV